jgi:hypothetical protein
VCAGRDYDHLPLEFEVSSGEKVVLTLHEATSRMFKYAVERKFNVKNILFPSMLECALLPSERRYERNVTRIRAEFLKIIRARKASGSVGGDDLI